MEMFALQRRLKDTGITVSGVDPGFVSCAHFKCCSLVYFKRSRLGHKKEMLDGLACLLSQWQL